jgi:hypothetical protein
VDVEVSTLTVSFVAVYESVAITISSVRHFTTLTHVDGTVGVFNLTEVVYVTSYFVRLSYQPIAVAYPSFTKSWIRITEPGLTMPEKPLNNAMIIGVTMGAAILLAMLAVIVVLLMKRHPEESSPDKFILDADTITKEEVDQVTELEAPILDSDVSRHVSTVAYTLGGNDDEAGALWV